MNRLKYDMASAGSFIVLMVTLNLVAFTCAGPLGPLPMQNITSADMGLKEGSCALGDVVYMSGDEFPGSSPCERCTCAPGGVQCAQQTCEPRPGCKALHRPDHCCPTYQCECEQEGRVYGNGEKLVDPQDPCRVCYCQGGEVVCRRIACFVRDDCTPRLVPGRCCPEYDNCPLRGVTALPGMTPSSQTQFVSSAESGDAPHEVVKQEITIKEITPVSEIPIITDVRIKEILPSPSIEVAEYAPSKSPLMPREATSEKSTYTDSETPKPERETPSIVEVHSTSERVSSFESETSTENRGLDARSPSKISLSTQDSINSEIYPSHGPSPATTSVLTTGSPATPDARPDIATTKAPLIEEEDPSLFDHNPAFPPLPDDLSVLSNHGDEIVPESSADVDHLPAEHALLAPPQPDLGTTTTETETKGSLTTTAKYLLDTSILHEEKQYESTAEPSSIPAIIISTTAPLVKDNPTIKLRSAIPTDTLSASAEVAGTQGIHDEIIQTSTNLPATSTYAPATSTYIPASSTNLPATSTYIPATSTYLPATSTYPPATSTYIPATSTNLPATSTNPPATSIYVPITSINLPVISTNPPASSTKLPAMSMNPQAKSTSEQATQTAVFSSGSTEAFEKLDDTTTEEPEAPIERVSFLTTRSEPEVLTEITDETYSSTPQDQTTSSIAKSNIATEITSQTELSSLPIETSDQNPHEASENVPKDTLEVSTSDPLSDMTTTTERVSVASLEVATVGKPERRTIENVETTEFILSSFGSSESSTDGVVELIKIPGDAGKSAAIIDRAESNPGTGTGKNALTDLIKLVSDVATMSEHTDAPASDSDELIPVNSGYKSKNTNFNQNSITEVPFKSKSVNSGKQKVVEIDEDEESAAITDSPAPGDKAEPTTRPPLIDRISDTAPPSKTERNDIEIIKPSYVPTISRRPTKVVQQPQLEEELPLEDAPAASASAESATERDSLEAVTSEPELATTEQ